MEDDQGGDAGAAEQSADAGGAEVLACAEEFAYAAVAEGCRDEDGEEEAAAVREGVADAQGAAGPVQPVAGSGAGGWDGLYVAGEGPFRGRSFAVVVRVVRHGGIMRRAGGAAKSVC